VNNDARVNETLRVAFVPNFAVSSAQLIYPAAEISEQISWAGSEASGTSNMKLMMNGAITLGTYDGANVEINEEIGDENMFLFGLRTEDVARLRPSYVSHAYYEKDPEIRQAIDMIRRNVFSLLQPGLFDPIVRSLIEYNDYYMLLADLRSYCDAQDRVDAAYRDRMKWNRMSLVNIARSGRFSSDRAVAEYARDIWHVKAVDFRSGI
jgi:starch phosphorylase